MAHAAERIDTTHYAETDDMGEGELQRFITELFRPLLARFLASCGQVAHVGANTFLYFEQFDSAKRIAPDIYVLPGIAQEEPARIYKLWEMAVPPSLFIEVVSRDVGKDYEDVPVVAAQLGVRELVVYDPEAEGKKGRFTFQVHRRTAQGFTRVVQTNADRVESVVLGCHLRVVGSGGMQRLRIATGLDGSDIFPTEAEHERAERAALEAEVALLRAELAKRSP